MADDAAKGPAPESLKFSIDAVVGQARAKEKLLADTLPQSRPLQEVCAAIARAGEDARRRVHRMKSPYGLGRIRLYLLILAAGWFLWWIYSNFVASREIRIAVPAADSELLRDRARRSGSSYIRFIECQGSTEGKKLVQDGKADFTVVQGGVAIPENLEIFGVVRHEHVLYFERVSLPPSGTVPKVITFNPGQGSHLVGRQMFERWGHPEVDWIHAWGEISAADPATLPNAHAAIVVVDPADPSTIRAIGRMHRAGYRLRDPYLGAHQEHFPFLKRKEIPPGFYHLRNPLLPPAGDPFRTYVVEDYLVSSASITDWQRSETLRALRMIGDDGDLSPQVFHTPGTSVVGDLANLAEATVNVVIIFAALFGLEIIFHRRYLHELNTLISRISLLQSEIDLAGVDDANEARRRLKILDVAADSLGLISSLAGYYGQEDASLLFSGMTGTIHGRANDLMINIQLKLLQGPKAG